MKELNKDENLSITGGYFPPTEEQLEKLNPIERIIMEKNEIMSTMSMKELQETNGGGKLGDLVGRLVGELVDAVADQLKKSPIIM